MFSQSAALEPMKSCHSRQKCLKWFWTQEPPCEINTRQVLVSARFSCSCPSPTIFTTVEKQATSANMFRERLWMDRMSKYSTKHSDPMWSKIINTQTIIDIWWHKMMTYECVLIWILSSWNGHSHQTYSNIILAKPSRNIAEPKKSQNTLASEARDNEGWFWNNNV